MKVTKFQFASLSGFQKIAMNFVGPQPPHVGNRVNINLAVLVFIGFRTNTETQQSDLKLFVNINLKTYEIETYSEILRMTGEAPSEI